MQLHPRHPLFTTRPLAGALILSLLLLSSAARANQSQPRETRIFRVSVQHQGRWVPAADLPFTKFYADRAATLAPPRGPGAVVRVRLEQRGGGEAHVDHVTLAGRPPVSARGAPLFKLLQRDDDVAVATHRPLELAFALAPGEHPTLALRARIEPEVISKEAFRFPTRNTFRPMTTESAFYTYGLGSRPGRLTVDGELSGERLGAPLFDDLIPCGSGHPDGRTYGWVRDDGATLYVAMDFTPDNTMDGEVDYARVFVKVGGELRSFTIRQTDHEWGQPGFTYTRRVGYQHKVYEFAIPYAELGLTPGATGDLDIAFAAYGTAAPGAFRAQMLAFDPLSRTYALRYWQEPGPHIHVQLYDDLGATLGAPVQLQTVSHGYPGGIAADSTLGRFLVIWQDSTVIQGRLVTAAGVPVGAEEDLTVSTGFAAINPRVAYDPDLGRYLLVWIESRGTNDILHKQFLTADASPLGSAQDVATIDDTNDNSPNLAYNGTDGEFLVVANHTTLKAWRLDSATGALAGSVIDLSASYGSSPDVAFESAAGTYLVAWKESNDVWCRLVHADGTLETAVQLSMGENYSGVAVAAQPATGRFLVVADNNGPDALDGWFIDSSTGTLQHQRFNIRGATASMSWAGVAANPHDGSFAAGTFLTGLSQPWVTVFPTLDATPTQLLTGEDGTSDTFGVRLWKRPRGTVVLQVSTSDPSEAAITPTVLTFDATTWHTVQTVTVQGLNDGVMDGPAAYTVRVAVDNTQSIVSFWDLTRTLNAVNEDDDQSMLLTGDVITGEDGTHATLQASLPLQPTGQVILDLAVSDPTEATVSPASLTFTAANYSQTQAITVTGVDDTLCDGDIAYQVTATVRETGSDPTYHGLVVTKNATNLDDEAHTCGNGTVECDEECDDGNTTDGDGCSATCTSENPECGNGTVEGTEECDDGNTTNGDGCSATCVDENLVCGNGTVSGSEECDDGNTTDGDGCDALCMVEDGWTCEGSPSDCKRKDSSGCGCRSTGSTPLGLALGLFGLLLLWRRRRA